MLVCTSESVWMCFVAFCVCMRACCVSVDECAYLIYTSHYNAPILHTLCHTMTRADSLVPHLHLSTLPHPPHLCPVQVHRALMLIAIAPSVLGFILIFVAFRNNSIPGLITLGVSCRSPDTYIYAVYNVQIAVCVVLF